MVEFNAVGFRQAFKFGVVGHDHGNLDCELPCLLSEEQVVQAVSDLGHHDEDLWLGGHGPELVVHLQVTGEALEVWGQEVSPALRRGPEVYPHEEFFRCAVGELLQIQDIEAVTGEDACHRVDDPWFIWA